MTTTQSWQVDTSAHATLRDIVPLGAKDFNAALDGSTDDTAALQAYADYLATLADDPDDTNSLAPKFKPIFYIPPCAGAVITDTLTIEKGISVIMDGPILVSAAANVAKTWVHIAPTGVFNRQGRNLEFVIDVRRVTLSDWLDEADVGCHIEAAAASKYWLRRADNFTVGVWATPSYGTVTLGEFRDCRYGLDISNGDLDFSNQSHYVGGEFACDGGTHTTLGRYGVRITNPGGGSNAGNSLVFDQPSFELIDAGAGEAVPFLVDNTHNLTARNIRSENSGDILARLTGDSRWCTFGNLYLFENQRPRRALIDDQSTYKIGNKAIHDGGDFDFTKAYLVFDSGNLADKATKWDGNFHSFADLETIDNTDPCTFSCANYVDSIDYKNGLVNLHASFYWGTRFDTRNGKTFTVVVDKDNSQDMNFGVVAFDASGNQITASTDILQNTFTPTNTPNTGVYGGLVTLSSSLDNDLSQVTLTFSDNVATAFIGMTQGIISSFRIYCNDGTSSAFSCSSRLAKGQRLARIVPTAGHYVRGARILNAEPAAGGDSEWVCTTTGQSGTLSGVTASTTVSTRTVVVNDASDLAIGYAITIAGVTGTKIIEAIEGLNVFVDSNCDATVSGAAVAYVAFVFKSTANIDA